MYLLWTHIQVISNFLVLENMNNALIFLNTEFGEMDLTGGCFCFPSFKLHQKYLWTSQASVMHACNPRYLAGWDWEDCGEASPGKKFPRPFSTEKSWTRCCVLVIPATDGEKCKIRSWFQSGLGKKWKCYLQNNQSKKDCDSSWECLPSKHEALSLHFSTVKKKNYL
jgi:hypothetical protein